MPVSPFFGIQRRLEAWLPDSFREILWTISLIVLTSQLAFDLSQPPVRYIRLGLTAAVCLLLALKIYLCDGWQIRQLLLITALLGCGAASAWITRDRWFFRFSLMVLAARGIPYRRICKVFLGYLSALLAINLLLTLTGFAECVHVYRENEDIPRHSLGFLHPNVLAMWMYLIVISALMLVKDTPKGWLWYPLLGAFAWGAYLLTDSRGGILCCAAALIGCAVIRLTRPRLNRAGWLFPVFLAAGVLLPLCMQLAALRFSPEDPLLSRLDSLFSGRLTMGSYALKLLPLTLLGNPRTELFLTEYGSFTLDAMYLNYPLVAGILPYLLLFAGILYSAYRLYRSRQLEALAVLASLLLFSCLENAFTQCLFIPLYAAFAELPAPERLRND